MLTSIQGYFSIIDFGFLAASMNKTGLLASAGNKRDAQNLINASLSFVLGLCILVVIVAYVCKSHFGVAGDELIALMLLIFLALISLSSSVIDSVFRANGQYGLGTSILETFRLLEWMSMIVSIYLTRSALAGALGALVTRCVLVCLIFTYVNFSNFDYKFGLAIGGLKGLWGLRKQAISWSSFRFGEALSIQGVNLLVGSILGPSMLAIVSTYRTLTRGLFLISSTYSHSLWPSFTKLWGGGDFKKFDYLLRSAIRKLIIPLLLGAAILFLMGPYFLRVWGHGLIPFERLPFLFFIAAIFCSSLAYPIRIALVAAEQLFAASIVFVILNVFSALFVWKFSLSYGVLAVGISMLTVEFLFVAYSYFAVHGKIKS